MEYRGLYVSATPDCEPNEGGYYCQVYADEDYGDQIDDFCIHPDELEENDDIKHCSRRPRSSTCNSSSSPVAWRTSPFPTSRRSSAIRSNCS